MDCFGLDLGFFCGSEVADAGSTYFCVKKGSVEDECSKPLRKEMRKLGPGIALSKNSLVTCSLFGLFGMGFLGLDKLIGIDDFPINSHHLVLYGVGTIKYLRAIANVVNLYSSNKIENIPEKSSKLEKLSSILCSTLLKKFYD